MRTTELTKLAWRKSSYSNSDGGACVEICGGLDAVVPIRDSKVPHRPALIIPNTSWSAFITALKDGNLS
ncbi:DUF397 domain-containing protein [Streptomyces sp. NPDC002514]|uniref:DUF397 domain-containing protein n=1 Tax=Streptomyces sp. NPDC001270 TaxID=3364554 RepID=UPI00367C2117